MHTITETPPTMTKLCLSVRSHDSEIFGQFQPFLLLFLCTLRLGEGERKCVRENVRKNVRKNVREERKNVRENVKKNVRENVREERKNARENVCVCVCVCV